MVYIYFSSDFEFSILILFITLVHAVLFYHQIWILFTGGFVFISIMLIFLNWKLREIMKCIRISVLWRNKLRLLDNMMTYNKFTKLVHEISSLINMLIGTMHTMTPIFTSATIMIMKNEPKSYSDQLIHLAILSWSPVIFLLAYLINHYCASIPLRNQSIAKYLYPVFYDKNFHRIENHRLIRFYSYRTQGSNILIHMKIDSFIARINEQYVGFHCLNLFQFTKLAILQHYCYFFTVYVLIYKLNKQWKQT